MPILKTCIVCGGEFKVPPSRAESAKTCSNECAYVVRGRSNQKRVTLACKHCEKLFDVPECHKDRRVYCSSECQHANPEHALEKSLSRKGDKNPMWKGGLTSHSQGYVLEKSDEHPFAVDGYVFQHRLVVERMMRKDAIGHHFLIEVDGVEYLRRDIEVHHKNEVKQDNDSSNLIACTSGAHSDMHDGRPVMRGTVYPEADVEIEFEDRQVQCKCETCGGSFLKKRSDVARGSGKFCTRECYEKSRATDPDMPLMVTSECKFCGSKFLAKRSKVLDGHGKFCSDACRLSARIGVSPSHKY